MNFAHVAIIKKPGVFDAPLTYQIPAEMRGDLKVGQGVRVPLKKAMHRGVVVGFLSETQLPDDQRKGIKMIEAPILSLSVNETQIHLAKQMSRFYHCSLLRCLKLMLPQHLWKGTGKRILASFEKQALTVPDPSQFPINALKHELTGDQRAAMQQIQSAQQPVLLHGVTGSGKTELYLRMILEAVQKDKQAILLLPEIALTPQMTDYFLDYFGDHMAVFHSKLSAGDRLKNWLRVQLGHARLIIGSRSAIFAPVASLGLIIIDEEHEWTYKQESSPYYQTHQVATMLSELTGARLIFGTATPRLETLHLARVGKYTYVNLPNRINKKPLPTVSVVDLRDEFKKKNYSIFSQLLFNKITDRLQKKEQIVLFVNQRGVARALVCRDCGLAMHCPDCDVSLKLHQRGPQSSDQKLLCHYCGFESPVKLSCDHCGSVHIKQMGVGTQRVEQDLIKTFPGIRVLRADKDTTSHKQGFQPIYEAFKSGNYDVLVGTQMVAKGHDFPNVTLIGLILADIGLHIPDFRSHERLFHLITQVSGRAGRSAIAGEVVLQTYQPKHHAIQMAANYEFDAFATHELQFREKLNYPPFNRLIKFTVLGQDLERLKAHIQLEKEVLDDVLKSHDLTASIMIAPALIAKLGQFYRYHVLIKTPDLDSILDHWHVPRQWRVDIDPVHTA